MMLHVRYLSLFIISPEVVKTKLHCSSHCTQQPVNGFMSQHTHLIKDPIPPHPPTHTHLMPSSLPYSLSPPCFMTLIDRISTAILSAQSKVLWQPISHPHLTWVYVRDVTAHVRQIQALNTCMIKLFKQIGHGRDSGGGGWGVWSSSEGLCT